MMIIYLYASDFICKCEITLNLHARKVTKEDFHFILFFNDLVNFTKCRMKSTSQ